MAKLLYLFSFLTCTILFVSCHSSGKLQRNKPDAATGQKDVVDTSFHIGAEQRSSYIPLLKGKRVAVIANQTSRVGGMHLVDQLLADSLNVIRVFAPEHGFRGEAGPGDHVESGTDSKTGIPVVSLYGSKRRPSDDDLCEIDVVIFDIQDVGVRFYTYISTLHYMMQECARRSIEVMVLDRPNPNGFYVDGPVLDTSFRSFVGIAPIPVVHGLTVGEYARMANGEGWLGDSLKCSLTVVEMQNYRHSMYYNLPVWPSPNLHEMDAIYLYPTLCLFEGTVISVGRGTGFPFTVMGFPGYEKGSVEFTPEDIPGVIKDPPFRGVLCTGRILRDDVAKIKSKPRLQIEWLKEMYDVYPEKDCFFNANFDKLAGNELLRKQIIEGSSASEIRSSWKDGLKRYSNLRKKYLLYP